MTNSDVPLLDVAESAQPQRRLKWLVRRQPVGCVAFCVFVLIALACAAAPVLAPYDPLSQDLSATLQWPTAAHPLGTDGLGRDILSRLLYGGRPALASAFEAALVYLTLGIVFGLVAGYLGGVIDRVVSGTVDVLMSLPSTVVMFAVLALFNQNLAAAMFTLGFFSSGGLVRVVRAVTSSTRDELYVSAARVSGLGAVRIMGRHILPRLIGPVIVQVSVFLGVALVVQSGLGFLNLGVAPPAPSWGGMVGEAAQWIQQFPWMLFISGGTIALTTLCFGLIGDAVRDATAEVRSRGGRTRPRRGSRVEAPLHVVDQDAILDIVGYSVSFLTLGKPVSAVRDVTFKVRRGEILGLVGESGSGKTVAALGVLGLLPSTAQVSSERMDFDGRSIRGAGQQELREIRGRGVGLVSQEPMVALDPSFTIGALMDEVIRVQRGRGSRRTIREATLDLLASVRLPDPAKVATSYPHELSGGMAQRVAIAIALAGSPKLLIADEPTTALDVTVQAEILDLLRALRREREMAILLVTHDLGVVADVCDRVIVMQSGRVVEQNDVELLFSRPLHPYTRQLIAATPSLLSPPAAKDQNPEATIA